MSSIQFVAGVHKSDEAWARLRERRASGQPVRGGKRRFKDHLPARPKPPKAEAKVVALANAKFPDEIVVNGRRRERAHI